MKTNHRSFKPAVKRILVEVCSLSLILLFVYAALTKLLDFPDFVSQLGHSPLLEAYAGPLAFLVPSAEFVIAALLIVPRFKLTGFYLSFMIMLLFSLYIAYVLHYAPYVPCACGGVLNNMGWTAHLIFNLNYAGIALIGLLLHKNILLRERSGQAQNL